MGEGGVHAFTGGTLLLPQERLKTLKKTLGAKSMGEVTVDQCIGGMRGIPVGEGGGWGGGRPWGPLLCCWFACMQVGAC